MIVKSKKAEKTPKTPRNCFADQMDKVTIKFIGCRDIAILKATKEEEDAIKHYGIGIDIVELPSYIDLVEKRFDTSKYEQVFILAEGAEDYPIHRIKGEVGEIRHSQYHNMLSKFRYDNDLGIVLEICGKDYLHDGICKFYNHQGHIN